MEGQEPLEGPLPPAARWHAASILRAAKAHGPVVPRRVGAHRGVRRLRRAHRARRTLRRPRRGRLDVGRWERLRCGRRRGVAAVAVRRDRADGPRVRGQGDPVHRARRRERLLDRLQPRDGEQGVEGRRAGPAPRRGTSKPVGHRRPRRERLLDRLRRRRGRERDVERRERDDRRLEPGRSLRDHRSGQLDLLDRGDGLRGRPARGRRRPRRRRGQAAVHLHRQHDPRRLSGSRSRTRPSSATTSRRTPRRRSSAVERARTCPRRSRPTGRASSSAAHHPRRWTSTSSRPTAAQCRPSTPPLATPTRASPTGASAT